jgi:hypothetical protein
MNRPASTDFVLGHRAGVMLTTGAAALTSIVWATQHAISWIVPAVALLLCKASFAAKKRVTVWRNWRGAWDEMAGVTEPSPAPAAPFPARRSSGPFADAGGAAGKMDAAEAASPKPAARRIPRWVLIVTWLLLLCVIAANRDQPGTPALGVVALIFLLLSAWGSGVALLRVGRWLFLPASARPQALAERASATDSDGDYIVGQCLPVARDVLPSGHVRDVLPE